MNLLNGCVNSGGFCLAVSVSIVYHVAVKVILTILLPIVIVIIVVVCQGCSSLSLSTGAFLKIWISALNAQARLF